MSGFRSNQASHKISHQNKAIAELFNRLSSVCQGCQEHFCRLGRRSLIRQRKVGFISEPGRIGFRFLPNCGSCAGWRFSFPSSCPLVSPRWRIYGPCSRGSCPREAPREAERRLAKDRPPANRGGYLRKPQYTQTLCFPPYGATTPADTVSPSAISLRRGVQRRTRNTAPGRRSPVPSHARDL